MKVSEEKMEERVRAFAKRMTKRRKGDYARDKGLTCPIDDEMPQGSQQDRPLGLLLERSRVGRFRRVLDSLEERIFENGIHIQSRFRARIQHLSNDGSAFPWM